MIPGEEWLQLHPDDEDKAFHDHYELTHGLLIERTEAMGNCGIDTVCLLAGDTDRTPENHQAIRHALVAFVKKHSGNRALIAMLHTQSELGHHIGLTDLEQSARELFAHHCCGDIVEHDQHVGEVAVSAEDGTLHLAVPVERDFSEEEIAAVRWKFNMHKLSLIHI